MNAEDFIVVGLLLVVVVGGTLFLMDFISPDKPKLKVDGNSQYVATQENPAEITFWAVNTRESKQNYYVEVVPGDDRFIDVGGSDGSKRVNLGPAEAGKETRESSVSIQSTINGSVDTYVEAKLFEQADNKDELIRTLRLDVEAKE